MQGFKNGVYTKGLLNSGSYLCHYAVSFSTSCLCSCHFPKLKCISSAFTSLIFTYANSSRSGSNDSTAVEFHIEKESPFPLLLVFGHITIFTLSQIKHTMYICCPSLKFQAFQGLVSLNCPQYLAHSKGLRNFQILYAVCTPYSTLEVICIISVFCIFMSILLNLEHYFIIQGLSYTTAHS